MIVTKERRSNNLYYEFAYITLILGVFCELYLSYVDLWNFAPSNYFFCSSLLLSLPLCFKYKKFIKENILILCIPLFLSLFAITGDFFSGREIALKWILKPVFKFMPLLWLSILIIHLNRVRLSMQIFIYMCIPTAIFAIFQGVGLPFAWEARRFIEPESFNELISYQRPSGLAYYFITLAEHMMVFSVFSLGGFKYCNKSKTKNIFFLAILGLLFTYTRSSILGFMVVSFLSLAIDRKYFKKFIGVVLTIIVFHIITKYELHFFILESLGLEEITKTDTNKVSLSRYTSSGGSRLYLLIVGLKMWSSNFLLGIGSDVGNYGALVKESGIVVREIFGVPGANQINKHMPHNYFLNTGVTYGLFGFLLLVLGLLKLLRELKNNIDNKNSEVLFYTIVCVSISSFFHNCGIFNSTIPSFVVALSMSSVYLNRKP